MSAIWTTAQLRAESERLDVARNRLASALLTAAEQLHTDGLPPSEALVHELSEYGYGLRMLASRLEQDPVAPALPQRPDRRVGWIDVVETTSAREQTRAALAVLDQVATLSHAEQAEFVPLQQCQSVASDLRTTLTRAQTAWPEAEVVQLANGWHPLCAVVQLATASRELGDDVWSQLQDSVADAFGRPLATALIRGRIRPQAATPAVVAAAAPVPASPPPAAVSFPLVTAPGLIEGAESPAPTQKFDDHVLTAPAQAEPSSSMSVTDRVEQLAREASSTSGIRRVGLLTDLVWQLIQDRRVPLAAQLAECRAHRSPDERSAALAAVLKALAMGPELRYSRGELARAIETELKPLRAAEWPASSDDESQALGYLTRAACLLPVLFGASPSAAAVLRSFPIDAHQTHFYNYCTRVLAFGERLQGQAGDVFQDGTGEADWSNELGRLQREADAWLAQTVQATVTYSRTSPLYVHTHWTLLTRPAQRHPALIHEWAKWQETLLLAHRLLRPIREGKDQERHQVRLEASRIASQVRVEPLDQIIAGTVSPRGIVVPQEAMKTVLLEAVDLANRWLRLCSTMPNRSPSLLPQFADELRHELLERTSAVLVELESLRGESVSVATRSAIEQCELIVRRICDLCGGTVRIGLHEPEPHHVLAADLLCVPGLELNDQWKSVVESRDFERILLEQIPSLPADWSAAFDVQCRAGDHETTHRLLELPVWSDEERRSLVRRRDVELHACRQAALATVDELRREIARQAHASGDLAEAAAEFDQRLAELQSAVPRLTNFAKVHQQLEQLRTAWTRCRQGESVSGLGLPGFTWPAEPVAMVVEDADPVEEAVAELSESIFG